MLNVVQTSEENAWSKLYQHFGGKENAKLNNLSFVLVNQFPIPHKVGDALEIAK